MTYLFLKSGKVTQKLSSAAFVIGNLRVNNVEIRLLNYYNVNVPKQFNVVYMLIQIFIILASL